MRKRPEASELPQPWAAPNLPHASSGPLAGGTDTGELEDNRPWEGWAHPHLVVDQVEDGIVGDPVQGKAGQPLLQRFQQPPDGRPPGEQLGKQGATLRHGWGRRLPCEALSG